MRYSESSAGRLKLLRMRQVVKLEEVAGPRKPHQPAEPFILASEPENPPIRYFPWKPIPKIFLLEGKYPCKEDVYV